MVKHCLASKENYLLCKTYKIIYFIDSLEEVEDDTLCFRVWISSRLKFVDGEWADYLDEENGISFLWKPLEETLDALLYECDLTPLVGSEFERITGFSVKRAPVYETYLEGGSVIG